MKFVARIPDKRRPNGFVYIKFSIEDLVAPHAYFSIAEILIPYLRNLRETEKPDIIAVDDDYMLYELQHIREGSNEKKENDSFAPEEHKVIDRFLEQKEKEGWNGDWTKEVEG